MIETMHFAPLPKNESERLAALDQYQLLDTPPDATYDAFTKLACEMLGAGAAMISLIDERRQWFKSHPGTSIKEVPREFAICNHVVATGNPLVVNDAGSDERFRDNPLVTGDTHVRFYAGVPLTTPDGHTIGTLCVVDDKPNTLTAEQLSALRALGRALMSMLDGRRRFLSLFDAANIDMFTIDPREQTIVYASRGACKRLGYLRRELAGMPIYDVAPLVGDSIFADILSRLRNNEEMVCELELRRRDGTSYPVELRLDMTSDGAEERVLAIAVDITQRQLQQQEIDLLLRAVNVAGDVIMVYRASETGELEVTYVNDAFTHQYGYMREEAVGRSLESFRQSMPDDDGMRGVRAALAHEVPRQAEIVSYRKDGSTFWNQVTLHPIRNADGAVTHWISIERDITDEVARTSTLAEEHDRLLALTRAARRLFTALDARTIVATVTEVISALLSADARVLAVSDDGLCVQIEELGGADWERAAHDTLVDKAVAHRVRVLDESSARAIAFTGRFGEARYVVEMRMRAGHSPRNTDLFVFDLIAEYFAVAARNVSLYLELEERRSAVLELNRTKTDLITMLAHDFRGPLTSIVGFADLTSEVGEVNEEQQDFLQTIKRSALQLSELATDTLTLSRLERNEVALQLNEIDLVALLRSIASQLGDRRAVKLEVEGDACVTGDDERLRQVFANLIDNAIKYTTEGPDPEIRVEGRENDVIVTVRDYGIGIPQGEISRVFDRFSRASNARKMRISGTGFGLFLTKQLVALHGGTIAVESTENNGSTFTVTLPRRVDRRAAPRTIVVLDTERDRSFLAYGLQEAGYRVITATAPDEVPALADAQSVDALIIIAPEELSRPQVVQFRTFSRERSIPIIAMGTDVSPRLAAAVTLQLPVLIGDVVSALDRLLTIS